jgi:hypothetical protein
MHAPSIQRDGLLVGLRAAGAGALPGGTIAGSSGRTPAIAHGED